MNTWIQRHLESKHIGALSSKVLKSTQNGSFHAAEAGGIISMNTWYDGTVVFDWSALHARLTVAEEQREKRDSVATASSTGQVGHSENNREGEDLSFYIQQLDEYGHQQIKYFGEESCMMTVIEIDAPWELQPLEKDASSFTTFSTRAASNMKTMPTISDASSATSSLPALPTLPSLQLYAFQRGPPGFRPVVRDVHRFLHSLVTQLREQKIRICHFLSSLVLFEGDFTTLLRHTAAVHKAVKSTGLTIHLARSSFSPCHVCRQRSCPVEKIGEGTPVTTAASSASQRLGHTTVATITTTTDESTNYSHSENSDSQICWSSIRLRDIHLEEEVDTFCTDLFFQWLQDAYDWRCLPPVKMFPLSHLSSHQTTSSKVSKNDEEQANETEKKAEVNEEKEEVTTQNRQIAWFSLFFHRIVYPALYTHLGFPALRETLEVEGEKAWMNELANKLQKKREWVGPSKWTTFDVRIVLCQLGAYQLPIQMVRTPVQGPCRDHTVHSDFDMDSPRSSPLPFSLSSAPHLAVDLSTLSLGSLEMEMTLSHVFAAAASYRLPTSYDSFFSSGDDEEGRGSSASDSLVRVVLKVRQNEKNLSSLGSSSSTVETRSRAACWSRGDTDALYRCVDRCQQRIYPPLDPLQYLEMAPILMEDLLEDHAAIEGVTFVSPPSSLSAASFSLGRERENRVAASLYRTACTVVVFFLRPTSAMGAPGSRIGEMKTEEGEKIRHTGCGTPWWPLRSLVTYPTAAAAADPMVVLFSTPDKERMGAVSPPFIALPSPFLSRHVVEGSRPWFEVTHERKKTNLPLSSLSSTSSCPTADASLFHTDEELWRLAKQANESYTTHRVNRPWNLPSMEEERRNGEKAYSEKSSLDSRLSSREGGRTAEESADRAEIEDEKWRKPTERKCDVPEKINPWKERRTPCGEKVHSHCSSPTPPRRRGSRQHGKESEENEAEDHRRMGSDTPPNTFSSSPPHASHGKGRQNGWDAPAHPVIIDSNTLPDEERLSWKNPMHAVHHTLEGYTAFSDARRQAFLFRWRVARWLAERWVNEPSWAFQEKRTGVSSLSVGGGETRERGVKGCASAASLSSLSSRTPFGVEGGGLGRDGSVLEAAFRQPSRRCRHCDGRGIECTLYWVGQTPRYAYLAVISMDGSDGTTVHALPPWAPVSGTTASTVSVDETPTKKSRVEDEARTANGKESTRTAIVVARVPIPWVEETGKIGVRCTPPPPPPTASTGTKHTPNESPCAEEGTRDCPWRTAVPPISSSSSVCALPTASEVVRISPAALHDVLGHDRDFRAFPFAIWRVVTIRAHAVMAVVHDDSIPLPSSFSSFSSVGHHSASLSNRPNRCCREGKYTLRCVLEDCFVTSIRPLPSSSISLAKTTAVTGSAFSSLPPLSAEVHSFQDLLWLIHESCSRYLQNCSRYFSLVAPSEGKRKGKGGRKGVHRMKAHGDLLSSDGNTAEATPSIMEREKTGQTNPPHNAQIPSRIPPSLSSDGGAAEESKPLTWLPRTTHVHTDMPEKQQMDIIRHGLQLLDSMRDTYSVHFKKRRESRMKEQEERYHTRGKEACTEEKKSTGWEWTIQGNASKTLPHDGVRRMEEGTASVRLASLDTHSLGFRVRPSPAVAGCPTGGATVALFALPTRVPIIRTCRDVNGMKEGPTIEFKYTLHDHRLSSTSTSSVDRLRHTIAAMASTLGGIVCIGVRDEDGAVVGHAVGEVKKESGKRLVCSYCPAMVKDAVTLQELPVLYSTFPPIGTGEGKPRMTLHTTVSSALPTRSSSSPGVNDAKGEEEASWKVAHMPDSPSGSGAALAKDWWKTGRMLGGTGGPPSLDSPSPTSRGTVKDAAPPTPSSSVGERRMTVVRIQRGQAPFYCVAKDAIPYQRGCASTTPMSVWNMIHRIFEQLKE